MGQQLEALAVVLVVTAVMAVRAVMVVMAVGGCEGERVRFVCCFPESGSTAHCHNRRVVVAPKIVGCETLYAVRCAALPSIWRWLGRYFRGKKRDL